jgi:DNA-binding response OmpR family regulator
VRTVLRRRTASAPPPEARDIRRIGDLTIDRTAHEVRRGSHAINVTPTEFRLLEVFSAHPGQVFTRDRLVDLVTGAGGGDVYDRTLDRHIANLRHKIEDDAQHPHYILTVYGIGYKVAAAE